ncbi:hypothetical protein, partial [Leptonema illini]|uniref:hypothetical protein n=1 Tax=Leptonema illini TaxID=183 RepID=UPI001C4E1958
ALDRLIHRAFSPCLSDEWIFSTKYTKSAKKGEVDLIPIFLPFLRVSVVNGFLSAKYANKAREMEIALVFSVPSATSVVKKIPRLRILCKILHSRLKKE